MAKRINMHNDSAAILGRPVFSVFKVFAQSRCGKTTEATSG
jgi:hypothetical protein